MKTAITAGVLAFTLAGCTSLTRVVTEEAPLHKVLNQIKSELSAYKHEVQKNSDKYLFTCGTSESEALINIKNIKVTVAMTEEQSRQGGGGVDFGSVVNISGGGKGSSSRTDSDKLELNFEPQFIPALELPIRTGGIADALRALTSELSNVDNKQPCLKGAEAKVTLGFIAKSTNEASGEIGLFVFSVEGKKSSSKSYANTIELTLDLNGQVFAQ